MQGNGKKIAKFLMRTFTCRSTFLYGSLPQSEKEKKKRQAAAIKGPAAATEGPAATAAEGPAAAAEEQAAAAAGQAATADWPAATTLGIPAVSWQDYSALDNKK